MKRQSQRAQTHRVRVADGWRAASPVVVATQEMLDPTGVDLDRLDPALTGRPVLSGAEP
jgi:hypothetical protein